MVEVTSVEVAGEILLALSCDVVDTVAEVDEESIFDECLAAGVDVLPGEPDAVAISHFLGGIRAVLREMLQNAVIGARHPVGVKSHNRFWLRRHYPERAKSNRGAYRFCG
ncbi:hypothetical protein HZS55_14340 [Halosimplex rubrum]|uniref:Uncharacterized protein n=1 Tax=Halosimplex rubrum TaxID=869889 RepID=A0A7D5P516_9EURY|nr:hypothetical protein [Halosimplex rubrum]QLH78404.1 hypothetical protein HZS55_14340 [Halosimplex rubrum]